MNTASATITALGFDAATGTLTLLNPVGGGGLAGILPAGTGPTDNAILGNDVLYVNVGGSGQIAAFTIEQGRKPGRAVPEPRRSHAEDHAAGLVVR